MTRTRSLGLTGSLGVTIVVALFALVGVAPSTADPGDLLPDLGMARLADFQIETSGGRRLLRYSSTIVNVGDGPFEAQGTRASTATSEMSVAQRIYTGSGGSRDVSTQAAMYFSGDGHSHWHIRDLEAADLIRLDNGVNVGSLAKHGFCFWDNVEYRLTLASAPQTRVYTGCGSSSTLLSTTMGLSVGWGDIYPSRLDNQYVDITGLTAGRYRLVVTADAGGWFLEFDETNNTTWVELQLKAKGNSIRVVGYGPNA